MKGVINIVIVALIALVTILIAFGYWVQVKDAAQKAAPRAMDALAIGGFVFFKKPKGISESTAIVLAVAAAVLVAFVLFVLFGGISSEAGPAASGLHSEFFDAVIRNLPSWG